MKFMKPDLKSYNELKGKDTLENFINLEFLKNCTKPFCDSVQSTLQKNCIE